MKEKANKKSSKSGKKWEGKWGDATDNSQVKHGKQEESSKKMGYNKLLMMTAPVLNEMGIPAV